MIRVSNGHSARLEQHNVRQLKHLSVVIQMYVKTALSTAAKLREIGNELTELTVNNMKVQRIGNVVTAVSSGGSVLALGACVLITGPFAAVALAGSVVAAGSGVCQLLTNYDCKRFTKDIILKVETAKQPLINAMDMVKSCCETIIGESTMDLNNLDELIATVITDFESAIYFPGLKLLQNLFESLQHGDRNTAETINMEMIKKVGGIALNSSAALGSLGSGTSASCNHSHFATKCSSVPAKSSSFQCFSAVGKVTWGIALFGNTVSTIMSFMEANQLTRKLNEVEKLPKGEQAKALNGLAKQIVEDAEMIEERIRILFGDILD